MSIVRKVFSDSAVTGVRSIFAIVRAGIIIALITKYLGTDSYGVWVTLISAIGLLSTTAEVHLHGSLIRYTSQESTPNQTYSDILAITLVAGSIVTPVIFVAGNLLDLSQYLGSEITNLSFLVTLVSVLVFLEMVFLINVNYPRARGRVKLFDVGLVVRNTVESLLLVFVFLAGGGLLDGLIVILGVLLLFNLSAFAAIGKWFSVPRPDPTNFKQHLRYAVPMTPQQLGSRLIKDTDKYILLFFLGPTAVGVYSVADAVCKSLSRFTAVFNSTLYPTVAGAWDEENYSEIVQMYQLTFRYFFIIGIPAAVGLVVLSDSLMTLVATSEVSRQGGLVVPVLILAYFFWSIDKNMRFVLTSAEKTYLVGSLLLAAVCINLSLNVVLVPRMGILGAGIGTLSSHLFLFLSVFYFSTVTIPIPVRQQKLIPWKTTGRSVFSTAVMWGVLVLVEPNLGVISSVVFLPILGSCVYFVVLFLIGEFSRQEIAKSLDYIR
jgi:O-antigen/teichoic acid export membrane protein